MQAQSEPRISPAEYLEWERRQVTRNEYVNGKVFAMTGASRAHNLVCMNLGSALHAQLRGRPCEVYMNDMRVKVQETGTYTYPDVVAACGEPRFEDDQVDTLLNPVLIAEVLSESTERYDRGAKFAHYREIDSLQEYLLVAQAEMRVEHYRRREDGSWLFQEYRGPEERVEVESLGCGLRLGDLYERVGLTVGPGSEEVSPREQDTLSRP